MNILIATNSFKNFASSQEISAWLSEGITSLHPDASIKILPFTDGGENTISTLIKVCGGSLLKEKAHDLFFTRLHRSADGMMRGAIYKSRPEQISPTQNQAGCLRTTEAFPTAVGHSIHAIR